MDDRGIIDLFWSRSEDAIPALERKFGRRLQRLAKNILTNEQDAQECVNDTYLAVWNALPPQRPWPLAPFVLRICKNIAVSRLRANLAAKRSGYEVALDELSEAIGVNSLEDTISARELGRAIDAFLDTLRKDDRVLFLRRYWYGDSVEELAKLFGLSKSNVSTRLNRIRNKLRTYLTKEGLL